MQHGSGKQVVMHAFPDGYHGISPSAHPVAQHPFAQVEDTQPLKLADLAVKRQFEHILVVQQQGDDTVADIAAGQDGGRRCCADGGFLLLAPVLTDSHKSGAAVDVQSQMRGYDFHA